MKKSIYLILLFSLILSIIACKKSDVNPEVTLDGNLVKSPTKYSELINKRTNSDGSFEIVDIKRNDDILTINVKGGCKAEDFKIVWDGHILLSYPGRINLVLYNESKQNCDVNNESSIKVNLSKILGKHEPKDFVFHVANGSKKQDTSLDPNGSVTNK